MWHHVKHPPALVPLVTNICQLRQTTAVGSESVNLNSKLNFNSFVSYKICYMPFVVPSHPSFIRVRFVELNMTTPKSHWHGTRCKLGLCKSQWINWTINVRLMSFMIVQFLQYDINKQGNDYKQMYKNGHDYSSKWIKQKNSSRTRLSDLLYQLSIATLIFSIQVIMSKNIRIPVSMHEA